MNRSEFLMALYDALEDMPKQDRTDAVSEYQEYFKKELENGRTEEEICVSLGDPITLAYAIKQRRGYGERTEQAPPKARPSIFFKLARLITTIVIIFTILSIIGISIGFSKGFTKGFSFDNFNFGIGKEYDVDEEKSVDLGSADIITIRVISSDTKVITSNSNKVQASLKGTVRTNSEDTLPKLEVTKNGNTILIEERRTISIGSYWSNTKMDIIIPQDFSGEVNYEGTSGNFTSSNLDIDSAFIRLASGDIKLDDIKLDGKLSITSTSGNIDVEKVKAKEISLESNSGDKELSDLSVAGTVHIKNTSGNNSIKDMDCKQLIINSTSGDIKISNHKGGVNIESTSGYTELSLSEVTEEINISALSGDIELKLPSKADFTLNTTVASGDIECHFDLDNKSLGKKSLNGIHGNGKHQININTTSGNIDIEKR